jgi:RNA polymerase sigma-70 factor (ECF subfamily)
MTVPDPTLNHLVEIHHGFVHALALRLAPAPGLAEDIAQQVFLEFISKATRWDLSSDIRPLLATMTRHIAGRAWRERAHQMPEVLRELSEHIRQLAEGAETSWFGEEERNALRTCIGRLPAKSRRLVELHYELGLTSVDIAEQMSIRADAVRRALFRLREQLRRCVQRLLGEGWV